MLAPQRKQIPELSPEQVVAPEDALIANTDRLRNAALAVLDLGGFGACVVSRNPRHGGVQEGRCDLRATGRSSHLSTLRPEPRRGSVDPVVTAGDDSFGDEHSEPLPVLESQSITEDASGGYTVSFGFTNETGEKFEGLQSRRFALTARARWRRCRVSGRPSGPRFPYRRRVRQHRRREEAGHLQGPH